MLKAYLKGQGTQQVGQKYWGISIAKPKPQAVNPKLNTIGLASERLAGSRAVRRVTGQEPQPQGFGGFGFQGFRVSGFRVEGVGWFRVSGFGVIMA